MPESKPPLPTNRAFVAQFRAPPAGAASAYMKPVSLPDLLAGAASLGIILFLWLQ
jgi:hypothetical protein